MMKTDHTSSPSDRGMTLASAPLDLKTLDVKHHFLLRKLHSLSGIVPIGVFLIEHLLTNSMAAFGPKVFNEKVEFIHHLPYLWALELFGIFLPLAFHAGYGVVIAMQSDSNTHAYPYMANKRYSLQRITGYIALIFIIIHLLKFRFAHIVGWGPEFMSESNPDKFEMTRKGLLHWQITRAFAMPAGITFSMYVIGLAAACFHFANGIWTFCISWGITVGQQAQKRMGLVAAAVGILLFVWGGTSLYAFWRAAPPTTPTQEPLIVNNS
jgi:succinate dehydrogenase / fumarate reductase cytochrome b subunit